MLIDPEAKFEAYRGTASAMISLPAGMSRCGNRVRLIELQQLDGTRPSTAAARSPSGGSMQVCGVIVCLLDLGQTSGAPADAVVARSVSFEIRHHDGMLCQCVVLTSVSQEPASRLSTPQSREALP